MGARAGIVGMGVRGLNLGRNLGLRGHALSFYGSSSIGDEDTAAPISISGYSELSQSKVFQDVKSFVESLSMPRIIFLMMPVGKPTDEAILRLLPQLSDGDVVIDGSNAHFDDTTRRCKELDGKGIYFLGCGFSGGQDAITNGPSVMPGGSRAGYEIAASLLREMAAKSMDGSPCCTYIGPEGAGHFAKIVHNGIEYAEMQLLAEVYAIMRWAVGLTPDHIAQVMSQWKETDASSYLIDITLNILQQKEGDQWAIDTILDSAGHRGTGVWAVQAAASFGIPAMMITAALHAHIFPGNDIFEFISMKSPGHNLEKALR